MLKIFPVTSLEKTTLMQIVKHVTVWLGSLRIPCSFLPRSLCVCWSLCLKHFAFPLFSWQLLLFFFLLIFQHKHHSYSFILDPGNMSEPDEMQPTAPRGWPLRQKPCASHRPGWVGHPAFTLSQFPCVSASQNFVSFLVTMYGQRFSPYQTQPVPFEHFIFIYPLEEF